jgi:hypothetical protein
MSYSFRFPYSIFMYQAPLRSGGQPRWYEVLRADDRNWAEYVAGLLHNAGAPTSPETKPVLKVVRYGNTLLALPDQATVERVERVIAKYESTEPRPLFKKTWCKSQHSAR